MPIDVLTLSTKGQLVLPSALRKSMSLAFGDKLVAYWSDGAIVLKKLELPSEDDFEKEIDETARFAKEAGIKGQDIADIIKEYRAEKKIKLRT